MATSEKKRYQKYERFYLRSNKISAKLLRKYHHDCDKKFGPLLTGDFQRSVLDVGCATGMLTGYLKNYGFAEVTGIDLNEKLIEQARENFDAEFIHSDALELLQSGRQFDIIFMLNVLEHIERDQLVEFITAVCQALKPGGFAVARTPNMSNIMAAGHLADDLTHCTGLTEQSLEQLALAAGFRDVSMLNQFRMQNFKGRIKAVISWPLHKWLWWLRGGTKPRVIYRNLYAQLIK